MEFPLTLDGIMGLPDEPCIYRIKSAADGRSYVGSSKNIRGRMRRHYYDLKDGVHHSPFLQRCYRKYGPDGFTVAVEMTCAESDLLALEQRVIDETMPEFNLCQVAGSCAGLKQSQATKDKRAASLRGSKRTPEQCARISAAKKARGMSAATREMLKDISAKRRFILKPDVLSEIERLRNADVSWQAICESLSLPAKALRRELRRSAPHLLERKVLPKEVKTKGMAHGMAKLSESQAREIKNSIGRPLKEFAKRFGITASHISDIRSGRAWACLD